MHPDLLAVLRHVAITLNQVDELQRLDASSAAGGRRRLAGGQKGHEDDKDTEQGSAEHNRAGGFVPRSRACRLSPMPDTPQTPDRPERDATTDSTTRSHWPVVGKAVGLLVLVAVVALVWNWWDLAAFTAWKQEAGPVTYFAAMAVLPALGLPITPFFILAGATFGSVVGLVGSLIALAANLTLCFWIARSGLQPFIIRLLRRFSVKLPEFDGNRKRAVRLIVLVKLAPGVPAFAKNYLLGAAGVPFWLYLGLSMAISGVYAVAFVILGESALERDPRRLLIALAIIAATAGGVWWWRRRRAAGRERLSERGSD